MAWQVLAEGNTPDALRQATPSMSELPAGTPGRVEVRDLPWHLASLFDLPLAEETFARFLMPNGARVVDAYAENGIGYVDFEVTGTPAHLIIGAIALALIALSILVATISVLVWGPEMAGKLGSWLMWGTLGALVVGGIVYLRQRRRVAT